MILTNEQEIAIARVHYTDWALGAGFSSLEEILKHGRRATRCGITTVEGGSVFLRPGISLAVLEALVSEDYSAVEAALDGLPSSWPHTDGSNNDGTYITYF